MRGVTCTDVELYIAPNDVRHTSVDNRRSLSSFFFAGLDSRIDKGVQFLGRQVVQCHSSQTGNEGLTLIVFIPRDTHVGIEGELRDEIPVRSEPQVRHQMVRVEVARS